MWVDYCGGAKGMLAPLSNYWGGDWPPCPPPPPTSSYAYREHVSKQKSASRALEFVETKPIASLDQYPVAQILTQENLIIN